MSFKSSYPLFSLLSVGLLIVGCGGKDSKPVAPVRGPQQPTADASQGTSTCSKEKCDRLSIEFGGVSRLGGSVNSVLNWNIFGRASGDQQRKVVVTLHESKDKKNNMEIRSGSLDANLLVYWKPLQAETGTIEFRARDVTRCEKLSQNVSQCQNMETYLQEFDMISKYPYEIKPVGETFDANNSEFFKSFVCDSLTTTPKVEEIDPKKQIGYDTAINSIEAISKGESVTDVVVKGAADYLTVLIKDAVYGDKEEAKTDSKPTAYDCLKQNSTAR